MRVSLTEINDVEALGPRFRALETVAGGSFFQGWSWTGCLAAERFARPVLLSAQGEVQEDVALALLNRHPSRLAATTLWLGESGIAALDTPYVEHNGVLARPEHLAACYAALRPSGWGRLVASGVGDAHLHAVRQVGGVLRVLKTQPAPFVDLRAPFLAALSAGTRYQLRRSARRYAETGALALRRAATPGEAYAMLDALAVLHQASWTARGRPGAFAHPYFRRFHHALIERALPRGEIELLHVTAGDRTIGYLYNFRYQGCMLAYQSGFDYAGAGPHEKPGLTCHHLAIERAAGEGLRRYDFLAGGDRYKTSLATGETLLHWLDLTRRWSPRGIVATLRA